MPDDNRDNFPQAEPPPHPPGESTIDNRPEPAQPPIPTASPQPAPASTKKGFPKIILFAIIFFLIISGLVFAFIKFRPTSLTFLGGGGGDVVWWGVQHNAVVYQPLIDQFESQNPGITVRYEKQSEANYRERLTSALASGQGPDIFEIHNSWPPMFRGQLSSLPDSVMSRGEFENSFYPIISSDLIRNESVIAMPLEYDALTLFINQDIFAEAARSAPETWNELRSLSVELTQRQDRGVVLQSGVALGITENVDFWPEIVGLMFYQNQANLAVPNQCNPACLGQDAINFYKLFSREGVWDSSLPASTLAFANGKLAMFFGPSRVANEIVRINPTLRFRTVPLPQLPKNLPTDPNYSYATYWSQAVWEKSKSKEAAWEFLKFMSSQESLARLSNTLASAESVGRVSPRPNMNLGLREDAILGSVVLLAPDAKSWYLADKTNDGETGINSRVNALFEDTMEGWPPQGDTRALNNLTEELSSVLSSFGISVR